MTKNRVRTIVTIIGIMLSAAMFTAVLTIITSLQAWGFNTEIRDVGNWHYLCRESAYSELKDASKDPALEYAAFAEDVGYAESGSQNKYKPYIFVLAADKNPVGVDIERIRGVDLKVMRKFAAHGVSFDVRPLPAGIYHVVVSDGVHTDMRRFRK